MKKKSQYFKFWAREDSLVAAVKQKDGQPRTLP